MTPEPTQAQVSEAVAGIMRASMERLCVRAMVSAFEWLTLCAPGTPKDEAAGAAYVAALYMAASVAEEPLRAMDIANGAAEVWLDACRAGWRDA